MISIYTGTPGAGKSLHIAQRIYYKLRANKVVIANFEINLEKVSKKKKDQLPFYEVPNDKLIPDNLIRFSQEYFTREKKPVKEDTIFLVIDEAQIVFNSREWQHGLNRPQWLSFFSQHRKYGYEVVLIAQFDGMIDKQIRTLIEYNYIHRKVSNFGIFGRLFSLLSFGKLFVAVKMWYPLNEKVGSEFFKAHKKYYSIYDTFANFKRQDSPLKVAGSPDPDAAPADLSAVLLPDPETDTEKKKQAV